MQDIEDKENFAGTGTAQPENELQASEFNSFKNDIQNTITDSGLTLSGSDERQTGQAVQKYWALKSAASQYGVTPENISEGTILGSPIEKESDANSIYYIPKAVSGLNNSGGIVDYNNQTQEATNIPLTALDGTTTKNIYGLGSMTTQGEKLYISSGEFANFNSIATEMDSPPWMNDAGIIVYSTINQDNIVVYDTQTKTELKVITKSQIEILGEQSYTSFNIQNMSYVQRLDSPTDYYFWASVSRTQGTLFKITMTGTYEVIKIQDFSYVISSGFSDFYLYYQKGNSCVFTRGGSSVGGFIDLFKIVDGTIHQVTASLDEALLCGVNDFYLYIGTVNNGLYAYNIDNSSFVETQIDASFNGTMATLSTTTSPDGIYPAWRASDKDNSVYMIDGNATAATLIKVDSTNAITSLANITPIKKLLPILINQSFLILLEGDGLKTRNKDGTNPVVITTDFDNTDASYLKMSTKYDDDKLFYMKESTNSIYYNIQDGTTETEVYPNAPIIGSIRNAFPVLDAFPVFNTKQYGFWNNFMYEMYDYPNFFDGSTHAKLWSFDETDFTQLGTELIDFGGTTTTDIIRKNSNTDYIYYHSPTDTSIQQFTIATATSANYHSDGTITDFRFDNNNLMFYFSSTDLKTYDGAADNVVYEDSQFTDYKILKVKTDNTFHYVFIYRFQNRLGGIDNNSKDWQKEPKVVCLVFPVAGLAANADPNFFYLCEIPNLSDGDGFNVNEAYIDDAINWFITSHPKETKLKYLGGLTL